MMNISEHHTRSRAIKHVPHIVIGALLGKQDGRNVEITDSFELNYISNPGGSPSIQLDKEYFSKVEPLVKQVSLGYEFIGWYATTSANENQPSEADKELQVQIGELMSNPIFLKLDPYQRMSSTNTSGALPIKVYESVIDVVNGVATMGFVPVGWSMITDEAEMIGLEHNAKITNNICQSSIKRRQTNGNQHESGPSGACDNLRSLYNALKMLTERVKIISKYIKDVHAGNLEYNHEIMCDISRLTQQFPISDCTEYYQSMNCQFNETMLRTFLGVLAKTSNTLNQFASKFNVLHSRHHSTINNRALKGVIPGERRIVDKI